MKTLAIMICVGCLTACGANSGNYAQIQRCPPVPKSETVDYLIENDRVVIEYYAETVKKTDRFGCVK